MVEYNSESYFCNLSVLRVRTDEVQILVGILYLVIIGTRNRGVKIRERGIFENAFGGGGGDGGDSILKCETQ